MLLLGFLVAIAFWPGTMDPASVLRWGVMAVGAPLLLFAHAREIPRALGGAGVALVVTMAASVIWSSDALNGIDQAVHVAIIGMVFCLGASATNLRRLWVGMAAGMTIAAVIAVAQMFDLHWLSVLGIDQMRAASGPGGLSVNKNMLAEAGLMTLILSIGHGIWWGAASAALILAITTSKAALGSLAFVAAIYYRDRFPLMSTLGVGALAIAIAILFAQENYSVIQRLDMWSEAIADMTPWGKGLGSFAFEFPRIEHAHNEYLQLAYELGVLAALPIGILIYIIKEAPNAPERYALIAICGVGLFSFPFHMPLTAFMAALCAGHLARRGALVRDRERDRGIPGEAIVQRREIPPGDADRATRARPLNVAAVLRDSQV